jgi:mono/diheme cytochrome c family protein
MRNFVALALMLLAFPAAAGEESIVLKDATGRNLVEVNCGACHSLDYIEMNAPFLDRKQWQATVAKMIDRFGAPIEDADVPAIVDYLVANYGP